MHNAERLLILFVIGIPDLLRGKLNEICQVVYSDL